MTSSIETSQVDPDRGAATREVGQHELAAYLRPTAFPARQDDLLALLIRKRAPSRLLWRLSRCSAARTYRSLDEVWRDLS